MNAPQPGPGGADESTIRTSAARWVVQHDRQLSPQETAEFETWLAADARHAAAFEDSVGSWQRVRSLAAAIRRAPLDETGARPKWSHPALGGLAAAACLGIGLLWFNRDGAPAVHQTGPAVASAGATAAPVSQVLPDGSTVRLRSGAELTVEFSETERRVRLVRGEAFFTVAKQPARPFLVAIEGVTVRAVGTAFAIRSEPHAVDVWVTEGTVRVTPVQTPAVRPRFPTTVPGDASALVEAGHRAVVARAAGPAGPPVVITPVSPAEISRALAWNQPMIELAGATLEELVAAFADRSGGRLRLGDASLRDVRVGGRYPAGDLDGFVRALEAIYDVKAERLADDSIVLRRAR